MAPTRAHTYLPVAPEWLTSQQAEAVLRNGSRNSRFTEIPPSVRHERERDGDRDMPARLSTRTRSSRAQPVAVATAKADIREANERNQRKKPVERTDGRTDGRTIGRCDRGRNSANDDRKRTLSRECGHRRDTQTHYIRAYVGESSVVAMQRR